jgi:hypothetical protein
VRQASLAGVDRGLARLGRDATRAAARVELQNRE